MTDSTLRSDRCPSPRIHADLVEADWSVSADTGAESMRRQVLQGRNWVLHNMPAATSRSDKSRTRLAALRGCAVEVDAVPLTVPDRLLPS